MKKLLLTAMAAGAVLPLMGQYSNLPSRFNPHSQLLDEDMLKTDCTGVRANEATRAADDLVIYNPPEGETRYYSREAVSYMYLDIFNMLYRWHDFGMVTPMVFTDTNVYLWKPLSAYNSDFGKPNWIEGRIEGDKLIFPMPQMIECIFEPNFVSALDMVYTYDEDGVQTGLNATQSNEYAITFTISNDGKTFTKDNPEVLMGLTDAMGAWLGFGDYNVKMDLFEDKAVEVPAGLTFKSWQLDYLDSDAKEHNDVVKVAVNGEDVYIKDFSPRFAPSGVVKATLKGDKLIFENAQFLEENEEYYNYLVTGGYELNPEDGKKYPYIAKSLTLTYNDETKQFSGSSALFAVSPGVQMYSPNSFYRDPVFTILDQEATPAAPNKPVFLQYMAYDEGLGSAAVAFKLPFMSVNGELLSKANIHYNVYVDDELQEFDPIDFPGFTEKVTDVPYSHADNRNFFIDNSVHSIYFPYTIGTVAIESVYVDEEGNEYRSERAVCTGPDDVWKEEESKVEALVSGEEVSVVFTDLTGKQVKVPHQGVFIRTATMKDGSVKSTKILVK